jgi:hypothetical protein
MKPTSGRGRVHGAEHVDAGAARQPEVEDHAVRAGLEDARDSLGGDSASPDDADVVDLVQQLDRAARGSPGVLDDENLVGCARGFHGATIGSAGEIRHRRALIGAIGGGPVRG